MPTLVEGSFDEVTKKEPTQTKDIEDKKPKKKRKTRSVVKIISRIVPTGFDALGIIFYGTIFSFFSALLQEKPVTAVYGYLGLMILTIIGIYFLKITEPKAKARPVYTTIDLLPALGFGFFIVSAFANIDSVLRANTSLSFAAYESANTWISFAIFGAIALSLVYAATLLIDRFEGKISDGEIRHPLALSFSFFSINSLVIATTVLWETFYLIDKPASGNIPNLIFYVLVFYFFVASPRLIGLVNKFSWPQLITAVVSIGYYIWYLLPRIQ